MNYFDRIRTTGGNEKCKAAFADMARKNRMLAAGHINDGELSFAGLYILAPEIKSAGLRLSKRNVEAVRILDNISNTGYLSQRNPELFGVLAWIFESGRRDDGISEEYDEIMEKVASVLINVYRDESVLRGLADMIFKRNKEGRLIHDLVWAYFRLHVPRGLKIMAEHMKSDDEADANLARELLGAEDPEAYIREIEENDPFLYFTDNGFQYSSNPKVWDIDLERKYLNRGNSSYEYMPVKGETEEEEKSLAVFKTLPREEKEILAEYSRKIHGNGDAWAVFMGLPASGQIETARRGTHDFGSGKLV